VVQIRKALEGLCAELASQNISSEEIDQLSQILEKAKEIMERHIDHFLKLVKKANFLT